MGLWLLAMVTMQVFGRQPKTERSEDTQRDTTAVKVQQATFTVPAPTAPAGLLQASAALHQDAQAAGAQGSSRDLPKQTPHTASRSTQP
jgi:hypothetical protein